MSSCISYLAAGSVVTFSTVSYEECVPLCLRQDSDHFSRRAKQRRLAVYAVKCKVKLSVDRIGLFDIGLVVSSSFWEDL